MGLAPAAALLFKEKSTKLNSFRIIDLVLLVEI